MRSQALIKLSIPLQEAVKCICLKLVLTRKQFFIKFEQLIHYFLNSIRTCAENKVV